MLHNAGVIHEELRCHFDMLGLQSEFDEISHEQLQRKLVLLEDDCGVANDPGIEPDGLD